MLLLLLVRTVVRRSFFGAHEDLRDKKRTPLEALSWRRNFSIQLDRMFSFLRNLKQRKSILCRPHSYSCVPKAQRKIFLQQSFPVKFLHNSRVPNGALDCRNFKRYTTFSSPLRLPVSMVGIYAYFHVRNSEHHDA